MTKGGHTIGYVLADTHYHTLAHNALSNSLAKFPSDDVLVFTDRPEFWHGYRHRTIDRIASIEDYNRTIISGLAEHAISDFYLVIQYDGFVLDGGSFLDEFLEYDYIGALWPHFGFHQVGNGGFSLRSRRLIDAVAELGSLRSNGEAEDVFICRTVRPLLERLHYVRFAEVGLAKRFAFESPGQTHETFGFHGFLNLPLVYRSNPEYLLQNLPAEVVRKRQAELMYGCLAFPENERNVWWKVIDARIQDVQDR